MNPTRRGLSLVESLLAVLLAGAVLPLAAAGISRAMEETGQIRQRAIALRLAEAKLSLLQGTVSAPAANTIDGQDARRPDPSGLNADILALGQGAQLEGDFDPVEYGPEATGFRWKATMDDAGVEGCLWLELRVAWLHRGKEKSVALSTLLPDAAAQGVTP